MDPRTLQNDLVKIGWPLTVDGIAGSLTQQAVKDFQAGYWRAGTRLYVDGVVGPQTEAALRQCLFEDGRLSAHFRFREFACKHCGWIRVHGSLPSALETYRARLSPTGVGVVSGYRCSQHNKAVGGASNSQHLYGTAADIAPTHTLDQVHKLGIFSGIEYRADGLVYHVDTRSQGPDNATHSSPANPSIFKWG